MPISDSLLNGKRCLVLDDEFLIALDIQQILELAGAKHVASVATASEAMELLRREPKFDIAVLDVKLGAEQRGVTAWSLARRLCFSPEWPARHSASRHR